MSDTKQLAALIVERMNLLERLLALSQHQRVLADGGDTTDLITLLGVKQKMLLQLESIERKLDPFREDDPESRYWESEADRLLCREQIARCEAILMEIVEQDCASEAAMIRHREETRENIQRLETGRISGAYLRQRHESGEIPMPHLDLHNG